MSTQAPRPRGRKIAPKKTAPPSWLIIVVGVVVLLAIVGAVVYSQSNSSANTDAGGTTATGGPIAGLMTFANLSRDHVDGAVTYPQVPPVGGSHNPVWMNCGIYDQPLQNENAVHSMEHGAVWVTYQPDLPADAVQQLYSAVRGHTFVLLSPYPGLPAPVVASAWGVQVRLDSASDPRLAKFIATYERGPQTPEPGAPCSGAKGVPLVK